MAVTAIESGDAPVHKTYPPQSAVISWIFFDWAAQPYFTLITTFVFAPYFATHVAADPASGQALWGFATSAAGMAIALASPVLGAVANPLPSASGLKVPRGLVIVAGRLGEEVALYRARTLNRYFSPRATVS